jgi:hypothetical protein
MGESRDEYCETTLLLSDLQIRAEGLVSLLLTGTALGKQQIAHVR